MITAILVFLMLHPLLLAMFWAWARTGWMVIAAPAWVIDVVLNYTTSSAIWGWPRWGEWTISKRLGRQRWDGGRRGVLAWRLAELLNKIKPGHIR